MIGDVAIPMPVTLVNFKEVIPEAMAESLALLEKPDTLVELATQIEESGQTFDHQSLAAAVGLRSDLVEATVSQRRLDRASSRASETTLAA